MKRRRQHRGVFVAAGAYNLTWGAWVALSPHSLYQLMGIPLPTHPEVAACLGMVIGLYGIIYLEIARVPEHGWIAAAVGLTGKVLGPAALAAHIMIGDWPVEALRVIVFNDLVWWLPFTLYLHDAWPQFRANLRSNPVPGQDPPDQGRLLTSRISSDGYGLDAEHGQGGTCDSGFQCPLLRIEARLAAHGVPGDPHPSRMPP